MIRIFVSIFIQEQREEFDQGIKNGQIHFNDSQGLTAAKNYCHPDGQKSEQFVVSFKYENYDHRVVLRRTVWGGFD